MGKQAEVSPPPWMLTDSARRAHDGRLDRRLTRLRGSGRWRIFNECATDYNMLLIHITPRITIVASTLATLATPITLNRLR